MSDAGEYLFLPNADLTFETATSEITRFHHLVHIYPAQSVVLDLSPVKTCDSAGLAFVLEVKRLCMHKKVPLSFRHWPEQMRKLAAFVGVETVLLGEA